MATKTASAKTAAVLVMIDPSLLLPKPGNRPVDAESDKFTALVASVAEVGVRVPPMAVAVKGGYQLEAGHRRTAAAIKANTMHARHERYVMGEKSGYAIKAIPDNERDQPSKCALIPVLVVGAEWGAEVAAVADLHQRKLTTGERIRLYNSLDSEGWTAVKIAQATGESRSSVSNCLGIEKRLCKPLQDLLAQIDELPLGKLLEVGGLPKPDQEAKWASYANVPQPGEGGKRAAGEPTSHKRGSKAVLTIIIRADGSIETSSRTAEGGVKGASEDEAVKWSEPRNGERGGSWTVGHVVVTVGEQGKAPGKGLTLATIEQIRASIK